MSGILPISLANSPSLQVNRRVSFSRARSPQRRRMKSVSYTNALPVRKGYFYTEPSGQAIRKIM